MVPSEHTNLMLLGRSRHKPQAGDIFAGNLCGRRWIIGRVIRAGFANGTAKSCLLLYFYPARVESPELVHTPMEPILLIPPVLMLSPMLWTRGQVRHVRNEPLRPSELLRRHVFKSSTVHRWVDECGEPVSPAATGETFGEDAFHGWRSLDDELSDAVGIPRHPWDIHAQDANGVPLELPPVRGRKHELHVYWPHAADGRAEEFDEFEGQCIQGMKSGAIGKWIGRGTNLKSGCRDVQFCGADGDSMLRVVRDAAANHNAPPGAMAFVWRSGRGAVWERIPLS